MIHSGEERTNGIRCHSIPSIRINFQGESISLCYDDDQRTPDWPNYAKKILEPLDQIFIVVIDSRAKVAILR